MDRWEGKGPHEKINLENNSSSQNEKYYHYLDRWWGRARVRTKSTTIVHAGAKRICFIYENTRPCVHLGTFELVWIITRALASRYELLTFLHTCTSFSTELV